MKTCGRCKLLKDRELFVKNSCKKDGLSAYCRECSQGYQRYAYKNSPKRREQVRACQDKLYGNLRAIVSNWLSINPCVDCGEADPVVLEFDHVRGEKKGNISSLSRGQVSEKTLLEEIQKCEVRCANCHRRRHHKMGRRRMESVATGCNPVLNEVSVVGSNPSPITTSLDSSKGRALE